MTRRSIHLARAAMLTAAVLIAGCAATDLASPRRAVADGSERNTAAAPLRIEGQSVVLGDATGGSLTAEALRARIGQRLAQGDRAGAATDAIDNADLAAELLLDGARSADATAALIAAALDAHAARRENGWGGDLGGWTLLLADRAARPREHARHQRQRAAWFAAARAGRFDEAARIDLLPPPITAAAPAPWPTVEARTLTGMALLASGRPGDAAPHLAEAADLAEQWSRPLSLRPRLFAALAWRMAGDAERSADQRERAASGLDPASITDPTALMLLLDTPAPGPGEPGLAPRALRARLGDVRLVRGAPQSALLAWRAAESDPGPAPTTDDLRLRQADALFALGQHEAATALLIGAARGSERPRALARLGVVNLRMGRAEAALAMLRDAAAAVPIDAAPAVHADFALTLLATGQHEAGLDLLRRAGAAFESAGDRESALTALRNELHFARIRGDAALAARVESRIGEVWREEGRGTVP